MGARRMLELLVSFAVACGAPAGDEEIARTSSPLDVTVPATELGLDDAVFRRVDSHLVLVCPPDSPFVCRSENTLGWACSELACAPSCEKIGCPGNWVCVDLGAGVQCEPP
jgi:hypothetical protein